MVKQNVWLPTGGTAQDVNYELDTNIKQVQKFTYI